MNQVPWWSSEELWRKIAIWVTAVMAVILILLTFDSVARIIAGGERVPGYAVINQRIYYRLDREQNHLMPVLGDEAPLFGQVLGEEQARDLVTRGKLTFQSKNCINCHTILGNGAYYAPDLTKAWLDPGWVSESVREQLMIDFLMDPTTNARTFGTDRRMAHLGVTEEEARGLIAFLKWTSAINTNGFPYGFTPIRQEGDQ